MAQFGLSGDPRINREWRDDCLRDDPVLASNSRGRISFATSGPDTRTTQLFINLVDNSKPGYRPYALDEKGFAAIGEVIDGMDIVDKLNAEYREAPSQHEIHCQGNRYVERNFPRLSRIRSAKLITTPAAGWARPVLGIARVQEDYAPSFERAIPAKAGELVVRSRVGRNASCSFETVLSLGCSEC